MINQSRQFGNQMTMTVLGLGNSRQSGSATALGNIVLTARDMALCKGIRKPKRLKKTTRITRKEYDANKLNKLQGKDSGVSPEETFYWPAIGNRYKIHDERLLALKDIEIKEGLKTKAYEISVLNQKHDELVKKSLLTKSQLEGYLKENTKVRQKAQSEKPCLYEIPFDTSNPANRFAPDREETMTLDNESRSKLDKDTVKPYDYTNQNSLYEIFKGPSLEYLYQLCNSSFHVDSGCTKAHDGQSQAVCKFMEKLGTMFHFGNDQFAPILGYGDLNQGNVTIKRVYYVEGLNHNLFSVGQFCDADLEDSLETTSSTPICFMAKASPTQAWLWHRRLSHLNFDYITLLSKKDIVTGLPKLTYVKDQLCSSCEMSKAKRSSLSQKLFKMPECYGTRTLMLISKKKALNIRLPLLEHLNRTALSKDKPTLVEAARTMLSALMYV
ncbi:retrovirus-related pol polyprotein from transposon TNT 1-94 [Tanacetum coccineum]